MSDDFPSINLSVLTARQRMVIVLRYFENWTAPEIAQAQGVSVRAVERCHQRAIYRLRRGTCSGERSYRLDDE